MSIRRVLGAGMSFGQLIMKNSQPRMQKNSDKQIIGWGLSGHTPYYLYGASVSPLLIIDGSCNADTKPFLGIPVEKPEILQQLAKKPSQIWVYPDMAQFGESITRQVREYADLPVVQAQIWADTQTEPVIFAEAQLWLTQHKKAAYAADTNHICLFISALDKGGAERQMVLLAIGLRQLGYHVTLICQNQDHASVSSWQMQLADVGVQREFVPLVRTLWQQSPPTSEELQWLRPLCRLLRPRGSHSVLALQRILGAIKPFLFIAYLDECNITAAAAANVAGCPSLLMSGRSLEPHLLAQQYTTDFQSCALSAMLPWYQAILQQNSGAVLYTNSKLGADSYQQWLGTTQLPTVTNAVADNEVRSDLDIRKLYQLPAESLVMLGIMRFTREKNPDGFIRVAARLIAEFPTLFVILIGDGEMRGELTQLATSLQILDRIILPGKIDEPAPYLAQANCLLGPSHIEGFPNVVLEAQQYGLPLVCSNAGGTAEALSPLLTNCLVPPGDENAMYNKLRDYLRSPEQHRILMQQVSTNIKSTRNCSQLATSTLSLLHSLTPHTLVTGK